MIITLAPFRDSRLLHQGVEWELLFNQIAGDETIPARVRIVSDADRTLWLKVAGVSRHTLEISSIAMAVLYTWLGVPSITLKSYSISDTDEWHEVLISYHSLRGPDVFERFKTGLFLRVEWT